MIGKFILNNQYIAELNGYLPRKQDQWQTTLQCTLPKISELFMCP